MRVRGDSSGTRGRACRPASRPDREGKDVGVVRAQLVVLLLREDLLQHAVLLDDLPLPHDLGHGDAVVGGALRVLVDSLVERLKRGNIILFNRSRKKIQIPSPS